MYKVIILNTDIYFKIQSGGFVMKINNVNQIKPVVNSEIRSNHASQTGNNAKVADSASVNEQHFEDKSIDKITKVNGEKEIVDNSIEQANKSLKQFHRVIERNVHETTKAIMYTVKDTETDEVIAEFPPKKIQDMIAKMWELAGLFVDEKA